MNAPLQSQIAVSEAALAWQLGEASVADSREPGALRASPTLVKSRLPQTRILVVEDDPSLRELILISLQMAGARVVGAEDGFEALQMLETEAFDLLISDLVMPKMNGVELIAALRPRWPKLPVVVMSGSVPLPVNQLNQAGVAGIISKPFLMSEFLERIEAIAGR